ncbi:MAG: 23S rRNA (pseudouridine(1915)-N(3))-methyltransferase RlmH [Alphaproteobacteria bacterium]
MKIVLRAGGVIRKGPERDMIDDYMNRANGLVSACGFHSVSEQQVDLRREKTRTSETETLLGTRSAGRHSIILDERGKQPTSRQIARKFDDLRQNGISELVITIGGADGFEPASIPQGTEKWAFGPQTWPHKMVRVMMSEQIYRALSILAGTPYHRD